MVKVVYPRAVAEAYLEAAELAERAFRIGRLGETVGTRPRRRRDEARAAAWRRRHATQAEAE